MAKPGLMIKLSPNMRPFISRVHRHGAVQNAFAERIGRPVGACVRAGVHPGMSQGAIREVVKGCAPRKGSVGLGLGTPVSRRAGPQPGRSFMGGREVF